MSPARPPAPWPGTARPGHRSSLGRQAGLLGLLLLSAAAGLGAQPVAPLIPLAVSGAAADAASAAGSAAPIPADPPATAPEAAAAATEAGAPTAPPTLPAQGVQQPRAFGHVLGDVLSQRIPLQQGGRRMVPGVLPPAGRVGLWLERRPVQREQDADGTSWLRIDYQVVNAPRAPRLASLPALTLPMRDGPALAVPAWPLALGPLSPDEAGAGTAAPASGGGGDGAGAEASPPTSAAPAPAPALPVLQPDRPAPLRPTAALERQLQQALAALAAVLLAWLAWWAQRRWRDARRLPLIQACQRLRRLDAQDPAAWRLLHEAINHSAGRVVHAASLPRLLDERPAWRPRQAELAAFFAASNARFFGEPAGAAPGGAPAPSLLALARALRDIETGRQP